MKILLAIERGETAVHSPRAWFVPGRNVAHWLDVICLSPWNQDPLRVAVLRTAADDPSIAGALLIPAQASGEQADTAAHEHWRPSDVDPLARPFGLIGGSVFLPVEARVSAHVAERQWSEIIPDPDSIYIWRPIVGLTEYPRAGLLRVADLIAPPAPSAETWDAAQPGTACNTRLRSLQPSAMLTFETLLKQAADDIGGQAGAWNDLPLDPNEPLLTRTIAAGGRIYGFLARIVAALSRVQKPVWIFAAAAAALLILLMWMLAGARSLGNLLGSVFDPFAILGMLVMVVVAYQIFRLLFAAIDAIRTANRRQKMLQQKPAPTKPGQARPATRRKWSLRKMLGALPGVSGLNRFAKQKIKRVQESIHAARERAVARLLYALENDPDIGLKFAIPLASEPGRGQAPPGATLRERPTDFALNRLGGGRPVDPWNLNDQWRNKLQKRYEELAKREVALGRHRRAAYIYAELLRNYAAAASVLHAGGAFREAAVLYEEKLSRPDSAAECLRRGGLLSEAIEIYKRLGEWETVGDLYGELDQHEESRRAYEEQISRDVLKRDYLGAARIAEEKLRDYDSAWNHLRSAWPAGTQASLCMRASFQFAGRRADRDRAIEQIDWARSRAASAEMQAELAGLLAEVAQTFPDAQVRRRAADETRLIAAVQLPAASIETRSKLTDALAALAPADKLLSRDCRRYRQAQQQPRHDAKPSARQAAGELTLVRQWPAPFDSCLAAVGDGKAFLVGGRRKGNLFVVRGNAREKWTFSFSKPWFSANFSDLRLAWNGNPDAIIAAHSPFMPPLSPPQAFKIADEFPHGWTCGAACGIDRTTVAFAYGVGGQFIVASQPEEGALRLAHYVNCQGGLVSTASYPTVPLIWPCKMAVFTNRVFLASGNSLWELSHPDKLVEHTLAGPATDIAVSRHHSLPRIAVATAAGVDYFVGNQVGLDRRLLCPEIADARLAFSSRGELLIAGRGGMHVYQTGFKKPEWLADWHDADWSPVAVLPQDVARTCIVITADSQVRHFRWGAGETRRGSS